MNNSVTIEDFFNPIEFDGFRNQASLNRLIICAKQLVSRINTIKRLLIPDEFTRSQASVSLNSTIFLFCGLKCLGIMKVGSFEISKTRITRHKAKII